jgi:hypothetical protein
MIDYRNFGYPKSDDQDDFKFPNPHAVNIGVGVVVAAVLLIAILAVAFGFGHEPSLIETGTAFNDIKPTSVTPITPTPNSPAQRGSQ